MIADALATAGAQRLVVVDPLAAALEAVCGIPVEMLPTVPSLAAALPPSVGNRAVVVAPDLGTVQLAEHYTALLGASVTVVRKNPDGWDTCPRRGADRQGRGPRHHHY